MAENIVLLAVDLHHRAHSRQVALEAVKLAKTHTARIVAVFVIPDQQDSYAQHYVPADLRARVQAEAETDLQKFCTEIDWDGCAHSNVVLRGVVYEKIVKHSEQLDASFVVIGANRPKLKDLFIGPNAARVARHANCSVLIVRPQTSENS